jgi:hypothetical protein
MNQCQNIYREQYPMPATPYALQTWDKKKSEPNTSDSGTILSKKKNMILASATS